MKTKNILYALIVIGFMMNLVSCSLIRNLAINDDVKKNIIIEKEESLSKAFPSVDTVFNENQIAYYINDYLKTHCSFCLGNKITKNDNGNYIPSGWYKDKFLSEDRTIGRIESDVNFLFGYVFDSSNKSSITSKNQVYDIEITGTKAIQHPSLKFADIQVSNRNNTYLSQSCSGYFNSLIDGNIEAEVPSVVVKAAVTAEYDTKRNGSILILTGEFLNPFRNAQEQANPSGLRINSWLWKHYEIESNRTKDLYMLKSLKGVLMSQFKEESEKADFDASLKLEVGEPTKMGTSAEISGGYGFQNLFHSQNWYCLIQDKLTTESFIKYNTYDEVKGYFQNIYKGFGVAKDKKKLALGQKVSIQFDFIGLDQSIGDGYLTNVSCSQNIFESISNPVWSHFFGGDGNEIWTATIEATVSSDPNKFDRDKVGSYSLDFEFFRTSYDDIKLKAIATISTNNNPQIDVQSSPFLLEGRLTADKVSLITRNIPVDLRTDGVSIRDFYDISLTIKNSAELPNIGLTGKIVKAGDEYFIVFQSQAFDADYFDMSNVTPLKVVFDAPINVGVTTINLPDVAELYFPSIKSRPVGIDEETEDNQESPIEENE